MPNYQLIKERFRIARKGHRCIWCGELIMKGERYRHEISKYEELQNLRWHLECNSAAAEYFQSGEEEFTPHENDRPRKEPTYGG